VQFDAHLDTYEGMPDWFGVRDSAAHWAARIAREGCVDPERSVQVGRRGHLSAFADGNIPDLGYRVIEKDEVDDLGPQRTLDEIVARVGENPVYVTFDLDVLDPSVAPAAATLEATEAGFDIGLAITLLEGLRGLNVIGADVVCLVPTKDNPNQLTSLRASGILFEEICLAVDSLTRRKG
jgi:guanidinopropionase